MKILFGPADHIQIYIYKHQVVILPTHEFFLFRLQWHTFCDFKDIIDISIKRACHEQAPQDSRMVTITRNDDRCLVRERSYNRHFPNHWFMFADNFPALIWFNTCMFIYPWFAHRKPSSRVSRRHFHLCHLLTATSDWPQTQATTSAKTLLLQVFWKGSKTIVTAQSRELVRLQLNRVRPFTCSCSRIFLHILFDQIGVCRQQAKKVRI